MMSGKVNSWYKIIKLNATIGHIIHTMHTYTCIYIHDEYVCIQLYMFTHVYIM